MALSLNKVITFFREAKIELGKVAWPSRRKLVRDTIVVIVISLVLAAILGVLDIVFSIGIENLLIRT